MTTTISFILGSLSTLIGVRMAYGSWPWESRKTWHYNRSLVDDLYQQVDRLEKGGRRWG